MMASHEAAQVLGRLDLALGLLKRLGEFHDLGSVDAGHLPSEGAPAARPPSSAEPPVISHKGSWDLNQTPSGWQPYRRERAGGRTRARATARVYQSCGAVRPTLRFRQFLRLVNVSGFRS